MMNALQENVPDEAIFKEILSLYFVFFLKQILEPELKRLSKEPIQKQLRSGDL